MARVVVILTARSSWAKLEPVCRALRLRGQVELQIVACGSALLERYGRVVDVVRSQGYPIAEECWTVVEGSTLLTTVQETGTLAAALGGVLSRLQPAAVVVCADRHEVLAAAQAASYLHLPLVHLQGGERSGSIDDKVRHAVTALADVHCVCTRRAAYAVYGQGVDWLAIQRTGCPSIDLAVEVEAQDDPPVTLDELGGVGAAISLQHPFVLCLQHPVSSEVDDARLQMVTTLEALDRLSVPRLIFWPAEEAGADAMSKAIRTHLVSHPSATYHTKVNLPPRRWLRLVTQAACLVGNSSTGIRECSYLGVPVVNIGQRQAGRERAENVVDVGHHALQIQSAIEQQMETAQYPRSLLYGDGYAGERTAEVLWRLTSTRSP